MDRISGIFKSAGGNDGKGSAERGSGGPLVEEGQTGQNRIIAEAGRHLNRQVAESIGAYHSLAYPAASKHNVLDKLETKAAVRTIGGAIKRSGNGPAHIHLFGVKVEVNAVEGNRWLVIDSRSDDDRLLQMPHQKPLQTYSNGARALFQFDLQDPGIARNVSIAQPKRVGAPRIDGDA